MATHQKVKLHDGDEIDVIISGEGPFLLLPASLKQYSESEAEEKRKWGVDPFLGQSLIDGLKDKFRVIAFDYESKILEVPKPDTLVAENIVRDFLAIADAANASQFAYYGYSWFALCGLQLSIRTDRMTALIMGGFPPVDGIYKEMLQVTQATYDLSKRPKSEIQKTSSEKEKSPETEEYDWNSTEITLNQDQTRQFVTIYEDLQDFDDLSAQKRITCEKLCFVGSKDKIEYGEVWGNVLVDIAGNVQKQKNLLEQLGWDVFILEELDHIKAWQPQNVIPLIRPWLISKLIK